MDSSTAQITKGKPEVSVGGCKFPMYSTEGLPYNGIEISKIYCFSLNFSIN
jgi:hypothetical protein